MCGLRTGQPTSRRNFIIQFNHMRVPLLNVSPLKVFNLLLKSFTDEKDFLQTFNKLVQVYWNSRKLIKYILWLFSFLRSAHYTNAHTVESIYWLLSQVSQPVINTKLNLHVSSISWNERFQRITMNNVIFLQPVRMCHQPCSWLKGLRKVIEDFSRNDSRPWQKWLSVKWMLC